MGVLEIAVSHLYPNGKRQGAQFIVGNVQGDTGHSLVVELEGSKRGVWLDFATGESGDVLALWACARGYALPRDSGDLLDDVGHWFVVPRIATTPIKQTPTVDDLGPSSAKWFYRVQRVNCWPASTGMTHPAESSTDHRMYAPV